jgi:integrase
MRGAVGAGYLLGGEPIGRVGGVERPSQIVGGDDLPIAEAVTELPSGPVIDTPKNHQRRELAVPRLVVRLLRQHLAELPDDPDAFAFPGRQKHTAHRQQSYHGFRKRFVHAATTAGLGDVTPHDLRATHATWVADSHGVLVAAHRLGHSNASVTTRHYARAVDGRDAEVARHLDKLGSDAAKRTGTQRARKPRKNG